MIRVIASAAILGALIAGGSVYAGREPALRNRVTGWLAAPAETRLATEAWPICTTMTAMGSESDWAQLDPDFATGKKALVAEDWNGAIAALKLAVLRDPRNADIQNYIGYAYRRLREMGPAMGHYQQALVFNPRHRSAHEHLGELYLALGEPIKAEEQLAALKEICLIPCDELADLERAIAAYQAVAQRPRPMSTF
jgi:tetratricopeptide (TPR) repeat protein